MGSRTSGAASKVVNSRVVKPNGTVFGFTALDFTTLGDVP
ncbi:hypothetical protein FTUN_4777 [Frigoriglobus tundricola]|uniref:Uncharacterized protein n=1 Tax=Frigoriglobus tundricola TaxID=2774151 RepID=A0A6M5YUV5_9BACT|nr:hypothetical protein FTUN_4777 [Frigoriglobus tundricola]